MQVSVLGPVRVDGGRADPSPRDRSVLSALAACVGESVTADALAAALWGAEPPRSWSKVVAGCVMRLRRLLEPASIRTTAGGYVLDPEEVDLDVRRFEQQTARGHELLALGEDDRAAHILAQALELWRGRPFADVPDWQPAQVEAARLDELRLEAEDALLTARLRTGALREAAAEARVRIAEAPLRERRWALLAETQYRGGRQADALSTLRRGRGVLLSELGLDPGPDLAALEQAILRQDPALSGSGRQGEASGECPYFGLAPAGIDDGERYFGRELETADGLRVLADRGVLVVAGPSGVGKSSFVRAGLAAELVSRGREVVVATPGEHPLEILADLPPASAQYALIVDQCEQALIICADPDERRAFFRALAEQPYRGLLVVAIRADRLGDLGEHPEFAALASSNLMLLGPLGESGLRSAIEQPARQAGLILEPGLADILVRDAHGGALPLLSHALRQIWLRREGRTLTVDGYRDSGEIEGSVAQAAEELYEDLPADERRHLREIVLRLVESEHDGGIVSRPVRRGLVAVDDAHARVVERLVDARLLTSDDGLVEVSHEALARAWPRLREWLDEDLEGQRILRHLGAAAIGWDAMGRPDSELYRGTRLAAAARWRTEAQPALSALEDGFLAASAAREEAELQTTQRQLRRERRTVRRLTWLSGAVAGLAVVAIAAGVIAGVQAQVAEDRATVGEARRVAALALAEPAFDRALLLAQEAIALWDAPETRGGLLRVLERGPEAVGVIRSPGDIRLARMALGSDGRLATTINADPETSLTESDVSVFDVDAGRELFRIGEAGSTFLTSEFDPAGERVAVSWANSECWNNDCRDLGIRLIDLDEAALRGPARMADPGAPGTRFTGFEHVIADVAFSPDGSLIAAIAPPPFTPAPGNVAVWHVDDPSHPLLLDLTEAGSNPEITDEDHVFGRVAFSPDGARLYASGFGPIAVFDVGTGEQTGRIEGRGILAVSPDRRSIAIAEDQNVAAIIDVTDAASRVVRVSHTSSIMAAAFSPDGRLLATASTDGTASVWNVRSGTQTAVLDAHAGDVNAVAFRPSGEVVTASGDGTMIVWDLDELFAGFRLGMMKTPVTPAVLDERTLVAPQPDGARVLVEADPADWQAHACEVAGRALSAGEWEAVFADRAHAPACRQ